jgi:hypothetical protein
MLMPAFYAGQNTIKPKGTFIAHGFALKLTETKYGAIFTAMQHILMSVALTIHGLTTAPDGSM